MCSFRSVLYRFLGWLLCLLAVDLSNGVAAEDVTYDDHVRPLFREHCLNCHNQNDQRGGLALDTYQAVITGGSSGAVVEAEDLSVSRLYALVAHQEEPVMPPEQDRLSDEKLSVISRWIEGGLLENSGSQRKAKRQVAAVVMSTAAVDQPPATPIMPIGLITQPVVESTRAAAATALATSPWAPLAAIAGQRQIALYNTQTAALVGVLPFPEGVAQSLQFSRDGGYLLAGGGAHAVRGQAALYEVISGRRIATVGDELDIVLSADINSDATRVALAGPQKVVRIFGLSSDSPIFELKKHTDWVLSARYSPDGVLLATGDRSGGLHVWEADTGRLYLDLPGHQGAIRAVAFQPDGNVLASASEDGTVKYWEMVEGKQIRSTQAHPGGVTCVNYIRDGRHVTAGVDGVVKLWDSGGQELLALPRRSEAVLEAVAVFDGTAIVVGDWNGEVRLHDIARPTEEGRSLPANPVRLETRLAQLSAQAEQAKAAAATAAQQRDALIAALAVAQQSADQASQAADLSGAAANQLTSELVAIQAQLQQLAQRGQELEGQLQERQAAAEQARQHQQGHQVVVDQSAAELTQQDQQLAALNAQLAELQAQLQASQMRRDEQAAMHARLQSQMTELTESTRSAEEAAEAARQELELFRQAYPLPPAAAPSAVAGS
jgi:hypothetical protein